MNEHAKVLKLWYQEYRPAELDAMDDPDSWISAQGEAMVDQIQALAEEIQPAQAELNKMEYMERVGEMNNARMRAREVVYAERMPV